MLMVHVFLLVVAARDALFSFSDEMTSVDISSNSRSQEMASGSERVCSMIHVRQRETTTTTTTVEQHGGGGWRTSAVKRLHSRASERG